MDPVLLSRIQFTITIMFHYLFPPLTIGLGLLMVIMEGMYLKTRNPVYESMTKFWTKIFALIFGMGVATGLVMEFQFGTNWATYSRFVGDIFGSALAAEGIFAFFLESGFLAILVFGWDKVSPRVHFFSTIMVALGSIFSAVWIIVANSWMQTPAGYHIVEAANGTRAEITDFWAVVFNPSSMVRLIHTLTGCFIQGSFFVLSVSAYYLLKRKHIEFAQRTFVLALLLAGVSSIAQPFIGHWHAVVVAEHQPAKLAAFEGIFETKESTPLTLFGWVDEENQKVHGLEIPGLLSFLVHGDFTTPVTGLDQIPDDEEPPLQIPFQSYHLMITLGMIFIGLSLLGWFFLWRGTLFKQRWLLWIFVFAVFLPFVANQVGWAAAEVGRQPWIVQGILRTSDGISVAVPAGQILASVILFCLIYLLLFALFIFLLDRKIKHGPEPPKQVEGEMPESMGKGDLLDAIARRGKRQYSMTEEGEEAS